MNKINHPNIMHLYDYFETDNNYYLVINYCNKGDLESYLRKKKIRFLDEEEATEVLRQIMNGFIELRKYKVMHRDLKLSNIFLHNDKIVIGDFGLAKTGKEMSGTKLGTPLMMAPELIEGTREYSSKTDLWSIGILFYQLLFGNVPFFGLSLNEVYADIQAKSGDKLEFPDCNQISLKTQKLLKGLLQIDPDKRVDWKDFFYSEVFKDSQNQGSYTSMKSFQSIEIDNPNCGVDYAPVYTKRTAELQLIPLRKEKTITDDDFNDDSPKNTSYGKDEAIYNTIKSSDMLKPQKVNTSPVKFRSTILINEIIKTLKRDELVLENSYRYCHELNKVSFLVRTCRRAIEYVINNITSVDQIRFLLPSIISLFNLAYFKCARIYDSLLSRENVYELYGFENFYRSERFEQLIDYYSRYISKLSIFKQRMLENKELNYLLTKYQLLNLLNDSMKEDDTKTLLLLSTKGIYSYFFNDKTRSRHKEHELLLISAFVALSLKLKDMFPYWIEVKKFKWETFVVNYENMDSQKLLDIIKLTIDNECK